MSRPFVKGFLKFMNLLFVRENMDVSNQFIKIKFGVLATILCGHGVYTFSTKTNEQITIVKKYKMNRHGYTDFMVIDDKGRHFNVNNSLWFWKWDSIEDWYNITEKEKILIKYYGWRVPSLGLFPNIILSNHKDFLKKYDYLSMH
jgi:hypothetical protein